MFKKIIERALEFGFQDVEIVENVSEEVSINLFNGQVEKNFCGSSKDYVLKGLLDGQMAVTKFQKNDCDLTPKEIDNIINAIAAGIINASLKNKLSELEEQKNILELENIKLKTKTRNTLNISDVEAFFESLLLLDTSNDANKKRLIDRFVRRVDLYNDKIKIALYPIDDVIIRKDINNNNGGNTNNNEGNENENNSNDGELIDCSNLLPSGPP